MDGSEGRKTRSRGGTRLVLFALSAWALMPPRSLPAQTFSVLHAFEAMPARPLSSLVRGADGDFYGTTWVGGAGDAGVVFKVTAAGTFTILHSFSSHSFSLDDGANPTGLIQGSDGNFYGTTLNGGTYNAGTVFRMTPAGTLTSLHSFPFSGTSEGRAPQAALVEGNDGNFYGTTTMGGTSDLGTFFRITPTGTLTTLYHFTGPDGRVPGNPFVKASDGNFYGTIAYGGANGFGAVLKFTPAGALTTLHAFSGGSDGMYPMGGLALASDGNFYGTTNQGGLSVSAGTVFRISAGGSFQTIHSFTGLDGQFPYSELAEGSGQVLYGTTLYGGGGEGSVYKITFAGALTTLHAFTGIEGRNTYAGLAAGLDGNFYGTTPQGGTADWGTVYSMTPAGVVSVVHDFGGGEGQYPEGGLVFGTDGNLYGLTWRGGAEGIGSFYKLTTAGAYSSPYSFSLANDGVGSRYLSTGSDGNLYGTAEASVGSANGSVFRLTPGGTMTTLFSFAGGAQGRTPRSNLAEGSSGVFYGTTQYGGASDFGTVFKLDASVSPATLVWTTPFSGSDGSYPSNALLLGSDGYLYGTTPNGGANDFGTVFKVDASTTPGTFVWTFSFAVTDGSFPMGKLVEGAPGEFYGTTSGGGANGYGTVFRITSAGVLSSLYSFDLSGTEGDSPSTGLLKGMDGAYYGVTSSGPGPSGNGAVFSITPGGVVTTLHSFSGIDGARPDQPLVQGGDGTLYGVTPYLGPNGGGVVFRVTLPSAATAVVSGDATICAGGSANIQAALTGSPPWNLTWSDGFTQPGVLASPVTRSVSPPSTMTYTLTAFSDASGPGATSGSATVTVNPIPPPPVITAPLSVPAGSVGWTASVDPHAGSTYLWTITNGALTAGQGTNQVTFTAGSDVNFPLTLGVVETSSGCDSPQALFDVAVTGVAGGTRFYTVDPCRLLDTRASGGPTGGSPLAASSLMDLPLSGCGIPATARSLALNIVAVAPSGSGHLNVFPAGISEPNTSLMNFNATKTRASNGVVQLPQSGSQMVSVRNASGGTLHIVIDVSGYFQ